MVQGVKIVDGHLVSMDPATGAEVGRVRVSTPEQVDHAVEAAKAAQPAWEAVPLPVRVNILKEAVARLRAHANLARLITQEMGKILPEAEGEVYGALDKDRLLELIQQANQPEHVPGNGSVIYRAAHGVVALCTPWNFPVDEILLLALPALAAGNTVVVKPSEVTPLCGAATVRALIDGLTAAGHPAACHLLQGDGEVGARLVSHDGVALVGMTGSSQTGSRIMESCARGLKRLVLELGGKDPMIVFGDADLDLAAKDAVSGSYGNAGQVCCAVERVYVDSSVRDEFAAKVLAEARQWVAGPGLDARSKLGPLVSSHQRATVHRHVQAAKAAGATVALGGTLPPESDPGYFYPATVLLDVPHDAVREETFGPVVSLTTFDGSESNACRLANDSEYGLSASVYTSDATKAARVGRALRAGQVGLNCYAMDNAPPECPWVGHKRSGFGYHSGTEGWRQFSTPKSLIALPGVEVASGAEPTGGGEQARSTPSAGAPAHAQRVGGGLGGRAGQWLPIAAALAVGVVLGVSMARRR